MKKFMFLAVLVVFCFGIKAEAAYVYPAWEGFNGATLPSPWLNGGVTMTGSAVKLWTNTGGASVTLALGGYAPSAFMTSSQLLDIEYTGTQASEVGVGQIQCLVAGGTGIQWGLQMVKNDATGAVNLQLQQLYLDSYTPAMIKVVDFGDIIANPVTSLKVAAWYKEINPIKVELWMTYNVNNTGWTGGFYGQVDATAMDVTKKINPWYSANSYSGYEVDNWNLLPEPATIMLLGLGSLALIRRKRA